MNYWQVAAGEGARDYSSVFLEYGVMLVGAGNPGSYFDNKAYANLLNLKDRHPYLEHIGGAPDLFVSLMPKYGIAQGKQ